jgi:hypothetical protein
MVESLLSLRPGNLNIDEVEAEILAVREATAVEIDKRDSNPGISCRQGLTGCNWGTAPGL